MPKQDKNVRRAAVSILRAWSKGHDYAESLISRHATRNNLAPNDRALLQAIIMAVIRHKNLLDVWIGKIRQGKLDHETRDILRVGFAQLMILRIPDHAAVNETVNCGRSATRGVINAVLRKALLLRKRFMEDLENLPLPIQYSHPEWLWKRWRKQFGLNNTTALAIWNNDPADNFVRINSLRPAPLDLDALQLEPTSDARFYKVNDKLPLEEVQAGHLYIQDPATRHAVDLLQAQPGETILDACAAPGGKACMIAEQMENKGELYCSDSNEKRLPRLESNLQRLGVSNAQVLAHDWTTPAPKELIGKFDAILADVPCSNTGVIRRRVDVKWRLKPEQFAELQELQQNIIENLLPCLKPTGRLIYSTCSIDTEENQGTVKNLIQTHPHLTCKTDVSITPFADHSDGAYAARIDPS